MKKTIIRSGSGAETMQNIQCMSDPENETTVIAITEEKEATDRDSRESIICKISSKKDKEADTRLVHVTGNDRRKIIENLTKELIMSIDDMADITADISNMSPDVIVGVIVALEFATEVCGCRLRNLRCENDCELASLYYMNEVKKYFSDLEPGRARGIFAGL